MTEHSTLHTVRAVPPVIERDPAEVLDQLAPRIRLLKDEMAKVIVGQEDVIMAALYALFSRGHCLLVGVPGLAKTLLVQTLAHSLELGFSRIQFTPDLMPSDITGTEILEEDAASGHRRFVFGQGPIFTQVLLADEINRTPPKTQAALLEAGELASRRPWLFPSGAALGVAVHFVVKCLIRDLVDAGRMEG